MTHTGDEQMNMEQMKNENERLKKELECWSMMLELFGINDERMSAALSFAFGDGDSSMEYLADMLNLSQENWEWYIETHGMSEDELKEYYDAYEINVGDDEE